MWIENCAYGFANKSTIHWRIWWIKEVYRIAQNVQRHEKKKTERNREKESEIATTLELRRHTNTNKALQIVKWNVQIDLIKFLALELVVRM